jgi:tRNA (cmo5U34)-methyltransferase
MKVDKNIFAKNSSWSFDKNVPKNFDKHIRKSVPLYNETHWLCEQISDFYIKDDSIVYDIGCSTGKLLNKIANRHKSKKKTKYIGLDVVKKMITYAQKKNKHKQIKFLNKNIIKQKLKKSDFIICFYTLQFIHPKHRQNVLNKLFKSLNWGGALFLVEKVRSYDARTQDQMTTIYEEFKFSNGFSEKEVSGKKKSLKGILEPFSSNANILMLKRAGFKDVSTISKFISFEGFLAIK